MGGDPDSREMELRARLVDALPEILVVLDDDSRITFAAGVFQPEANLGPEDLVGQLAWDLIHPDDLADSVSSLAYLSGYDDGPVGPFVFRYLDRDGNVRIADAVGINRSADPVINGTVMLLRDVVGPEALEQAFESLALGESLPVIAGHILRAVEEPPIAGIGWVLAPSWVTKDGQSTPTIEVLALSVGASSLASLAADPCPWILDPDAAEPVIDADLSTTPAPMRDAIRALGQRSLLAMPVRPPGSTHPVLWLVACNRWEEPSTANEIRTIRKYSSVLSVSFERIRLQAELHHAAVHDGLTGLANRSSFMTHLDQQSHREVDPGVDDATCALLYLDLDDFKPVNDGLGHHVGDQVLIEVGRRITSCARSDDVVARLGGDEFAVLLPRTTAEQAEALASRIEAAVAEPITLAGSEVCVGVSIGIAVGAPSELEHLLEHADTDMYRAKATGRARD